MMQKTKRVGRDLTQGPVMKILLTFAIPMILTQVLQQAYSAVDLMIIGHYAENMGTVAVATGGEVSDFLTLFAMAFATGSQVYISQLAGAQDERNLKEAVGTMLTVLFGFSLLTGVFVIFFHDFLLDMLNCPAESRADAARYMMITAAGMPFIFGYNGIAAVLRGMGESRKPLIFIAVAATVNIFADLLLVAVIPLGVAGTAIATMLSQVGSFAAAFYYMLRHRDTFDFELKLRYFKIRWSALRRICMMAIPQLIRSFCVQGSMLWVKSHVNVYGMLASSTYSIGNKIEKFMQVFVMGVDGAAGAMIGQNIGARKMERVNKAIWCTLLCNLSVAAVVVFLFLGIPDALYGMFTEDQAVIEFGRTYLQIMSLGMVIVAVAGCFKSIATGAGAALLSFWLGVMDGVGRILACLIAFHVFHQGVQSYFWGAAFCMVIPGLMSLIYFLSGRWKNRKLLSEK